MDNDGQQDLEKALLSDAERTTQQSSSAPRDYQPIRTDSDTQDAPDEQQQENTAAVAPVQGQRRRWKIPRAQYEVGIPVYGAILGFMTSWTEQQDDLVSIFMRAIYALSFLVSAQLYFGFHVTLERNGCCCAFLPRISLSWIKFPHTGNDVSALRWLSGPLSWVFAAISFMPPDGYQYLEDHFSFPRQSIVQLVFMIQLLYYVGFYNICKLYFMPQGA